MWYFYREEQGRERDWPMDKLKLLIADGTEDFRVALANMLRGAYQVRCCSDGIRARELLQEFSPDVLILDLMLPGFDGISLLRWAAEWEIRPMVLATSRFINDYVAEEMSRMGVGYLMLKPCDLSATVARVGDLGQRIRPVLVTAPEPANQVSNLLLALGIPTKLRGYAYLREAVLLIAENPSQSITKVLYPEVARRCGRAAMHVERGIRSAVAAAWSTRDENIWRLYFQPNASGNISRPTNAAFISRLADSIRSGARENP